MFWKHTFCVETHILFVDTFIVVGIVHFAWIHTFCLDTYMTRGYIRCVFIYTLCGCIHCAWIHTLSLETNVLQ